MYNSILIAYEYVYIELKYLKTEAENKMSKCIHSSYTFIPIINYLHFMNYSI